MGLEDIARKAGVSRATVSRVINNHPYVKDEVRRRVMAVIEQEGFHPSGAARALARQRTEIIGVIAPEGLGPILSVPYFSPLLEGISAGISRSDYVMALWVGQSPEEVERMYRRILSYRLMDGALLLSAVETDILPRLLLDRKMPQVMIGRSLVEGVSTVDVDNVVASRAATEHLIRLGRQRIAHLTGALKLVSAQERLLGYRMALAASKLGFDETMVIEGDYGEASGYAAARRMLALRADAIFAASDTMALGLLRGLRELGVEVPKEVAIIGFDDLPSAAQQGLSTVRQPIRELGSVAVQMLIDTIEGRTSAPQRVVLPTELIIRATCGTL